jgi:nitrite reductase/ring-hydroxylating ferredoxin subunit
MAMTRILDRTATVSALDPAATKLSGLVRKVPVGLRDVLHGVQGRVDCIVCPWHGSTFALDDGSVVQGPATAPQPTFDVQLRDDLVLARVPA